VSNFLAKHPELVALVPVLLDRGDPYGRKFALRLALAAQTPEMLQALEEFALGQTGPDQQRIEAANGVSRAGKWPSGPRRLWIQGEYREILLLGFELDQEPKNVCSNAEAQRLSLEAAHALYGKDPAKAQLLLQRALDLEPDSPVLFNNLALCYQLQGRTEKSRAMVQEMHQRFPDYWFGRITLARTHIQNREFEQARAVLAPMLAARRLHIAEFASLCMAEIDLLLAQGQRTGARSWFDIWKQANPDHPQLEDYRNRVSAVSPLGWLLGRR
jgi:tetratricopeptide (TPR) repeat protein